MKYAQRAPHTALPIENAPMLNDGNHTTKILKLVGKGGATEPDSIENAIWNSHEQKSVHGIGDNTLLTKRHASHGTKHLFAKGKISSVYGISTIKNALHYASLKTVKCHRNASVSTSNVVHIGIEQRQDIIQCKICVICT